jgi:hypothetical protein
MQQFTALKTWLGMDWIFVIAVLAGFLARLAKPRAPKWAVPYLAIVIGAVINVAVAFAFKEPLLAAATAGAMAGGIAVGGHELLKRLLARLLGDDGAIALLGKGCSKK